MDDADLAAIREQQNLSRAVRKIQTNVDASTVVKGPVECEDCGEEIPPRRLEVHPGARRCIPCQTAAER
ncbi:TraR/DksA C4-type zinc finger protein [Sulfitobacter sp. R18_1]|nr:TraR/DksA C4-type zinc finger protein [Sulfitobacter sp. R18_1]